MPTIPKEVIPLIGSTAIINITQNGVTIPVDCMAPLKVETVHNNREISEALRALPAPSKLLPSGKFWIIEDYNTQKKTQQRPLNYYRYSAKSAEQLDKEIEYDVDDEDLAWLAEVNVQREREGLGKVTPQMFEYAIDRLEKESFFLSHAQGIHGSLPVDENAVCCICRDGECENTNAILFCDACNIPVHQECYGVPFIPEGQWLCRRCQLSPSTPISCVLCPNKGGAFKQTTKGAWAHVACALWIPEAHFANDIVVEPINIDEIPKARFKLCCSICGRKGACIQCHKQTCYTAYHVTCAQRADLYMKIESVEGLEHPNKISYCEAHTPANSSGFHFSSTRLKKKRKKSYDNEPDVPVMIIPSVGVEEILRFLSKFSSIYKKKKLAEMILSYWTLKRQSRSGIPLLRRLQSQNGQTTSKEANHFQDSSHLSVTVQNLRLGLERLRLLAELCLKREKLKKECVALKEDLFKSVVFPLQTLLLEALDGLNTLDVHSIFAKPVDSSVVIGYLDIIKQPMDLGTMRQKAANHKYHSIQEFEEDFSLMIANAKKFNSYGHFVHMEARRIGAKGKELLKLVKKSLSEVTFGENGVVVSLEKTVKNEIMGQQARGTQPTTKIPPLKRKRKFFQNSGGAGNLENFEEQVYENGLPLPSAHDPTIGEQKPKLIRNFSEKDTKKSALKVKKLPEFYQSAKKAEHDAAALLTHSLEKPQLSSDASPIITWESNNHPPIVDDEGRSIIYDCLKGQYMYGPRRSRRNCLRPSVEPVFQQEETPAYHESPLSLTSSNDTSPSLSVVNEKSALPSEEPQVSPDNLHSMEVITNESELACSISPKQNSAIVWAKQDTFPYYPAKIVKPPFRRIPQAVLKAEHEKSSCLVLYFDKRKTWGWIPEKKIRPLGRKEADLEMLSKLKGHWKKNVRIAYNKALKELEGNKT